MGGKSASNEPRAVESDDPAEETEREVAGPSVADAPHARKKPLGRRLAGWVARVVIGLVVGLAIAEVAFSFRDHGAFPHLNTYRSDSELGLRLRPGATERVAIGPNPITSVRIGNEGYRGAGLPAPSGGEIIVVGDSQVFGLGVEENETASADLGGLLHATVINAGVPTYGPLEYNAVTKEMLDRYQPSVVVYVVNFANDLFEANHPNTTRHVEWDGWAVRQETAPEHITRFPGRELLYGQSHAFFALRSFLYAHGPKLDDRGFASEGNVADLVGASRAEHEHADDATKALAEQHEKDVLSLSAREVEAEAKLENAALDAFDLRGYELGIAYQKSRNNAGDIVLEVAHYAEESRGPPSIGQEIFNGAKVRKEMEEKIRAVADKKIAIEEEQAKKLTLSLTERDELKKRLEALRAAPAEIVRAWSPMTPLLRDVKALCDAKKTKLLVVALPMDIQVSNQEWAKYGKPDKNVDMTDTRVLIDDLVSSSEALGAMALDATPALKKAEPGAFLDGDIHMTPKGQRALAEAIAQKIQSP